MPHYRGERIIRDAARFLHRHRRWTRIATMGVLVYVAIIAVTGGIDARIGPVRFRSHQTDWLLRLAAFAALVDLLASQATIERRTDAAALRGRTAAAAPVVARIALGIAAVAGVLWIAARLVAVLPAETPEGDMALLELYTREASRNELLLGPYSRFAWNHPGPAMFYLFRPLYELSGGRFESLRVAALLLNVASLGGALAIVRRHGGPSLLLAVSLVFALHLLRVPDVLASPWNPHLQLLPLALLLVALAGVIDGRPALAVLAVAVGSFLVQTHLGVTPAVALLMAVLFGVLIARAVRGPERAAYRRWTNLSLWVALACWLLPVAQEFAATEGNLTAIYESFMQDPAPGPAPRESYAAFFQTFTSFLLPGFATAWGGLIVRTVTVTAFVLSTATLVGLVWAAGRFRSLGNRFGAALCWLLLGTALVALWSVLQIQGEIYDQLTFWLTIPGALAVASVAAAPADPRARRPRLAAATGVAVVVVAVVTAAGAEELYDRSAARAEDPNGARIREAAAAVDAYLVRENVARPLVHVAQPTWHNVAGVVLILQKSGRPVSIEPGWVFMFGRSLEPTGSEDCDLVFADPARRRLVEGDARYRTIAAWPDLSIHAACPRPDSKQIAQHP